MMGLPLLEWEGLWEEQVGGNGDNQEFSFGQVFFVLFVFVIPLRSDSYIIFLTFLKYLFWKHHISILHNV